MRSRSGMSYVMVIAMLVLLSVLAFAAILLAPQIRRWLNPAEEIGTIIEDELNERFNPTPTIRPDPATIIRQVRNLSRLETVSYTIEKVITAETGQDVFAFLFGDRLLFVAHGQVIAGTDLGRLQEGDVTVLEDDRVMIVLPPAEVFVVTLDNEKSYVYDRETGILGLNQDLETAARQAAELEILNAALEDGILETADINARTYLQGLIAAFGFREVLFVEATPTPVPPTLSVTIVPATADP